MTELIWIHELKQLTLSVLLGYSFDRKLKMAAIKVMLDSVLQHKNLRKYSFL